MNVHASIPVRVVNGIRWLCLANMSIKKIEVVAYDIAIRKEQYSFAGGHRHRLAVVREDIHLNIAELTERAVDISNVALPAAPKGRRHHKGR
jgi:hypothetical protein